jgi:uncharacterized protein YbaA (DUF1428 family)
MSYVDGFLLPVPKKNMKAYVAMSKKAGKVWRSHGALEYFECVIDDAKVPCGMPFPKGVKSKAGETVVFSWIVYRSKAHRNAVNKKVMKDPRMNTMMKDQAMPFDPDRMMYGGFKVVVEA